MTLDELQIGQSATLTTVGGEGALRQHFLDMGLIPGEEVTLVRFAPLGDPMELMVQGYELTLRKDDAQKIEVTNVHQAAAKDRKHLRVETSTYLHPGLGETGKYHEESEYSDVKPIEGRLTFALVGNQNCGKTTLFNQLTGSNQHVGNFPGVTVDQKTGVIRGYPEAEVVDLPGIYSLSPYTSEEIVSREFILKQKPTGIINIVDATNLTRNLYLTMQLMELDIPMVLAINMMDEMKNNGGSILINEMERLLQIPVVPISAVKNQGVGELVKHAIHVARYQEKPGITDFCDKNDHHGALHRALHGIMHLIEDHAKAAGIPLRFAASKLVEGDPLVEQALALEANEKELLRHILAQLEEERGLDCAAAMADMRFLFIRRLCERTVVKPQESKEHARSQKIDCILTGKYTAIPIFILIMGLVFFLTFNVIGAFLQDALADGIDQVTAWVDAWLTAEAVNPAIRSLVVDAIFQGVGSVLSFAMVADSQDSILAFLAGAVAPLFAPLGLADWKLSTALISGFMAKESVVSTLTVLYGTEEALSSLLTPGMALTFLTFCLLYTPCIAAITSVKRENGTGWAVGMIAFQCVVAWIAAFAVHLMLSAFGVV